MCARGRKPSKLVARNFEDVLLRKVGEKGTVKVAEATDPKELKKSEKRDIKKKLEAKTDAVCKGHDITGVDWEKTWQWIGRGDLKRCTKALICSKLYELNTSRFTVTKPQNHLCVRCTEKKEKSPNK